MEVSKMKNMRIGIMGTLRGGAYLDVFKRMDGVTVTCVCDFKPLSLKNVEQLLDDSIKVFDNFEDFINSGLMDAVVLCNYFAEHAPFAVKAMEHGIHVFSECTPAITMAECVQLCRTVEKTGCKYMLAENYPFFACNMDMKRRYDSGKMGCALFCEGEYNHPGDTNEINCLAPGRLHWRNWIPRTYYLTHALAPILYITGNELKSVNCKCIFSPDSWAKGTASMTGDIASVILCEMKDGSLARVGGTTGWGGHGTWYRICGEKGQMESVRGTDRVRVQYNGWQVPEGESECAEYPARWYEDEEMNQQAVNAGHGGGDWWAAYYFTQYVNEDVEPFFDVYRAVSISATAILAMRSALNNGIEYKIPDFRNEEERKLWENDNASPFPDAHGNATMPCCSHPDYRPTEEDYAMAECKWRETGLVTD